MDAWVIGWGLDGGMDVHIHKSLISPNSPTGSLPDA